VSDGRQEGGAPLGSLSGTPGLAPTGPGAQAGGGLPGTPDKGPVPSPGAGGAPVLTPKNLHALRTLFNIAHRLCRVLGPSWEIGELHFFFHSAHALPPLRPPALPLVHLLANAPGSEESVSDVRCLHVAIDLTAVSR